MVSGGYGFRGVSLTSLGEILAVGEFSEEVPLLLGLGKWSLAASLPLTHLLHLRILPVQTPCTHARRKEPKEPREPKRTKRTKRTKGKKKRKRL